MYSPSDVLLLVELGSWEIVYELPQHEEEGLMVEEMGS